MKRDAILEKVYEQITRDVLFEDFTSIEQLLKEVSNKDLLEFLTEEDSEEDIC